MTEHVNTKERLFIESNKEKIYSKSIYEVAYYSSMQRGKVSYHNKTVQIMRNFVFAKGGLLKGHSIC